MKKLTFFAKTEFSLIKFYHIESATAFKKNCDKIGRYCKLTAKYT